MTAKPKYSSIAILGGTFNPIHYGHMALAKEVKTKLGYEVILFIPASIPAHKEFDNQTTADHRIKMIELAVGNTEYIRIDTCEIERGGVSYSIDTVEYLKKHYAFDGKPGLIIGDDLIDGFYMWKQVDVLTGQVNLIVAHRTSSEKLRFDADHTYLDNQIISVSSSDIRSMIRRGENIDNYLPESVVCYIEKHRLYRRRG